MKPMPWDSFPFVVIGHHFYKDWMLDQSAPLGVFDANTPIKCIEAMGCAFEEVVPCWVIDEERIYNAADEGPVFERLGSYCCKSRRITLYIKSIEEAAKLLGAKLPTESCAACAPLALNLAVMVFVHELGHALHHWRIQVNLTDIIEAETLAEHFTVTAIESFGSSSKPIFDALEAMSPKVYREWRKAGPTTWAQCRSIYDEVGRKSSLERNVDPENQPDVSQISNLF